MKKILVLGFMLLILLALLIACSQVNTEKPTVAPTEGAGQETPVVEPTKEPVVLRVGGVADPGCWNPIVCARQWQFNDLVMEGFTGHGPFTSAGCSAVPRLAESWEQSEDGLTWTWHLFKGIKYSDGTPLTAQTVVDFFNWWNSTELIYWYPESSEMQSIEAVDDYTVKMKLNVPINNYPNQDSVWFWIFPPHIWGKFDDAQLAAFDNYPPIGTGPYVVTDYQPGKQIIYEARDDYYRGKLPVDKIVYQIYQNPDAMINAFLGGELDLLYRDTPIQYISLLSNAPNTTVYKDPPNDYYWISFNVWTGDDKAVRNKAVLDPAVREAVDYAIPKQKIVDIAMLGNGVVCPTNWACGPNYAETLNPDLVVTPFDPAIARSLLEKAGYVDSNGDGVREAADGTPLKFRFYYEETQPNGLTISDIISSALANVGITLDVEVVEQGTLIQLTAGDRNFDMAMFFWGPDLTAHATMNFYFSCWAAEAGIGGLNYSGYCNEDFDNLVYESWYAGDPVVIKEKLFEAEAILNKERPVVVLAAQNIFHVFHSDKFEFPQGTCGTGLGVWNFPSVLEIKVK